MGKVKHTRNGNKKARPVAKTIDLTTLETNINSLDEAKRIEACNLLSDLCRFNAHQPTSLDRIASRKILGFLVMRLVDHSVSVKQAAFRAARIMSEVSNELIIGRLISCGLFRTTLACIDMSADNEQAIITQQHALYIIANIISTIPTAVSEIVEHNPRVFTLLMQQLTTTASGNISLINTIFNVLSTFTKLDHDNGVIINQLLGVDCVRAIHNTINLIITQRCAPLTDAIRLEDVDQLILLIQCLEILTNISVNPSSGVAVLGELSMVDIVQLTVSLLTACSRGCTGSTVEAEMEVDDLTTANTDHSTITPPIGQQQPTVSSAEKTSMMVTMYPEVELVQMISEWFIALVTKLSVALQLSPSSAADDDDENEEEGQPPQTVVISPQYRSRLETIVTALQSVPAMNVFMPVIVHLRHVNTLQTTAPPPPPQRGGGSVSDESQSSVTALSHEAVKTVIAMEKTVTAMVDLLTLQQSTTITTIATAAVTLEASTVWPMIHEHAAFLHMALDRTSATLDTSTQLAVEGWTVVEADDLIPLKNSIITQTASFFELLSLLLTLPMEQVFTSEEQVKEIVVLLLQWLSLPHLEVLISLLQTMTVFASEAWIGSGKLNVNYLFILANGVMNRIKQPAAFSSIVNNAQDQVSVSKQQNLMRSQLLLRDAGLNVLIDFFSADNRQYMEVFVRLKLPTLLQTEYESFIHEASHVMSHLSEDDQGKVQETSMNLAGFLQDRMQLLRQLQMV